MTPFCFLLEWFDGIAFQAYFPQGEALPAALSVPLVEEILLEVFRLLPIEESARLSPAS